MIKFSKNYFKKLKKKYDHYNLIANFSEIGRRYFVMNSFDGILTIMGILVGSYFAGIITPKIIITTSVAAAVAMSVSGFWGTYLSEEAERKKALIELEKQTLHKLKNTKIQEAGRFATYVVSFIDGASPLISSLVVILPFFFGHLIPIKAMYTSAISIAFVLLMLLGGYLGKISEENIWINALKMVVAGVVSIALIIILQVEI